MRLNTPEDALATDGLMLDLVRRHLDSSSEERLRWSQLLKKRYLLRKVVLVYLHTLASHNVDHREWPYPHCQTSREPPCQVDHDAVGQSVT